MHVMTLNIETQSEIICIKILLFSLIVRHLLKVYYILFCFKYLAKVDDDKINS